MTKKRMAVIVTTISDGGFLFQFKDAVTRAQESLDLTFIVIGDINTNPNCIESCRQFCKFCPCDFFCQDQQELFLKKIGFPSSLIPYRSDNRRNVGFLMAMVGHYDVVVSIDDDNFPVDELYFLDHCIVGEFIEGYPTQSDNSWFNVMSLLDNKSDAHPINVYPRGFPYKKRWEDNSKIDYQRHKRGWVATNVGLWLGDPDIDAPTRLVTRCVTNAKDWDGRKFFILDSNHRTPINTQNTCIKTDALIAYYFVRMGCHINSMRMDRFGDIFSGYFLQLCCKSLENLITVGRPLVMQIRNQHNLLKDLQQELPGILIIEELVPYLQESLPTTTSYYEAYGYVIERLRAFTSLESKSCFWTADNLNFIRDTTDAMAVWRNVSHAIIRSQ